MYLMYMQENMCAVYGIGLSESSMYSPELTEKRGELTKKGGGLLSSL